MRRTGAARLLLLAWAGAAGNAGAHTAGVAWDAPSSQSLAVLAPMVLATLLYCRGLLRRAAGAAMDMGQASRAACFSLGMVLLWLALVWPLDAWAQLSFAAHMGQHMLLAAVVPPLLLLGRPGPVLLRGLPAAWRPMATAPRRWPGAAAWRALCASPAATSLVHGVLLWGWHLPAAFELALRQEGVHWLEHATLLGSGVLLWRALLRARGEVLGWCLLWMLVTVIHSGLLGALITLAPRPLYGFYVERGGVPDVLADQQLAGLIMWVPMGTVYLVAGLALAGRGLLRDAPAGPQTFAIDAAADAAVQLPTRAEGRGRQAAPSTRPHHVLH